jgi:hypothetical protein
MRLKTYFVFVILCIFGIYLYKNNNSFTFQINNFFYRSLCDRPISYSIGFIDNRFNLSKSDLLKDTKRAKDILGRFDGHELIYYDPQSLLKINMVYDQRQQLSNQVDNLENKINTQKQSLDAQISQYETDRLAFTQKVTKFQNEVNDWNNQGGAPPDVYDILMQEKSDLQNQAENLNNRSRSLNLSTQDYNADVGKLNQSINRLGETLAKRPEEGLYDPQNNNINIYFDIDKNELIHTLAHEMGHAIGLNHVDNPNAIMYKYSSSSIKLSIDDKNALENLCQKHPIWEIGFDNLTVLIQNMISIIKSFMEQTVNK